MAEVIKKRDATKTKQKILHSAEKLFAENGPSAAVDMIADDAGISKRMIYHYFGSKENLWRAVIQYQYEKVAEIETDLPEDDELSQIISSLIARYYKFLSEDKYFVKILMYENLQAAGTAKKLPIRQTKFPLIKTLEKSLKKTRIKNFDSENLLIDCLALSFFYFSNQPTLSALFRRNLSQKKHIEKRLKHVQGLLAAILNDQ